MRVINSFDDLLSYLSSLKHPTYVVNDKHYQWPLDSMRRLDQYLGSPSQKLKVIHIAGTNGKGSCCNFIATALIANGFKVGTYTSPQLFDIRERIRINGELISEEDIISLAQQILITTNANASIKISSYSEVFVEMAFLYFYAKNVDIAIVETGIGGKLDPTNIIETPLISVITSIGLAHTELFGESVYRITAEKCGIIKKHSPVVVGYVNDDIKQQIKQFAEKVSSSVYFSDELYPTITDTQIESNFDFDLSGYYQLRNIKTTLCTLWLLNKTYPNIFHQFNHIKTIQTLKETSKIMNFRGRWEVISNKPKIIVDVCDNAQGIELNMKQLEMMYDTQYKRLVIILGLTSSRKLSIKKYLPTNAFYIYTEAKSYIKSRELAKEIGLPGIITDSVKDAIKYYKCNSKSDDLVYIGGSIHVVSEALSCFKEIFS